MTRFALALLTTLLAASVLPAAAVAGDQPATGPTPFTATLGADGVQRATLVLDNYSYEPSHLIVEVNRPVELTLVSESGFTPHNIVIDDPASALFVRKDVGSGKTVKVTFTPTVTGSFAFYCDKKAPFMASHREKGMEGVIEVR
jgi:plastocyanin